MPQTHILKHKSWNVYNKDNRERVARDEAAAAAAELETQRRTETADREARLAMLRARGGQPAIDGGHEQQSAPTTAPENQRFELFADVANEKKLADDRKNADHEKEEKRRKEAWEKKVGLLNYLDQSQSEPKPFYEKNSAIWHEVLHPTLAAVQQSLINGADGTPVTKLGTRIIRGDDGIQWGGPNAAAEARDAAEGRTHLNRRRLPESKDLMDPLTKVKRALGQTGHNDHVERDSRGKRKHGHEKHVVHTNPSHETERVSVTSSKERGSPSIEELRAQRLARESRERARTQDVLRRLATDSISRSGSPMSVYDPDRYSQQYNPEIAQRKRARF